MSDRWRRFFCDDEARRAPVRLEWRAPVLRIRHEDLECSWSHPRAQPWFAFPWARRGGQGGPPAPAEMMTDLRELDAVRGGAHKLAAALEEGLRRPGPLAAAVVSSGCVPAAIGDDVPRIMREAPNPRGVPLIFNDCAAGRDEDEGLLLLERLRAEPGFGRARRIPRSVNLVGFPEGPALDELAGLLERSGVRVNARGLPALDEERARRLPAAAASVALPNAAYEALYDAVVPGRRELPAPYGLAGTRRWLLSVAGPFGRGKAAERAFAAELAPWARRWNELRARARGLRFAFVGDRAELARLSEPRLLWGVPVLAMLREAGVRAEVLVHGRDFGSADELSRRLREGAFDAAYSEHAFDERLARAGIVPFSLAPFEPGVRGAVATLERLLALGRWRFFRRYGALL